MIEREDDFDAPPVHEQQLVWDVTTDEQQRELEELQARLRDLEVQVEKKTKTRFGRWHGGRIRRSR